jgi:glycosyltransferase involved in cell wall biosynthesis
MIRILHILPNFGHGGAEKLVADMLLAHDKEKFEVAVCSLFSESGTWIENKLRDNMIKIFYLNKHLGPDFRMLPELFKIFRTFRPTVVHTHRYVLRYTLLPALIYRIPVKIHTVHNVAEKEVDSIGRLIHRIAFKLFNVQPIGISQQISKTVKKLYRIKTAPYIYNGIPTEAYNSNGTVHPAFIGSIGLSAKQFISLHVGRFSPQKNHRLLIEAFSDVLKEIPDAVLLLVGDGELRPEIVKLTHRLGLEKSVQFLGARKDVPELLAACDLLVLSSDWEGVPLAVLEAMAAGKPVVSTAVGGVPELVVQGETGLLVPPGNTRALTDAITWVYKNPSGASEMGEKGREIAKAKFDVKTMTSQYENLYLNLIGKRRDIIASD